MNTKRLLTWGLAALLLVLLAAGGWRALQARKQAQAAAAPAARAEAVAELAAGDLVPLRTLELAQGLPISGSLKAADSAVVKARVGGELQGLTLREGDAVRAGQVVARIDATEFQARVAQAQQQADAARAQVEIAQRQFDNNKALVDQGFISRTALDTSQSTLAGAQASHRAALAAVDVARKSLDDTLLRAPISGVVSQRLAQPGERVGVDARIVEIVDLRRLELEATLPAADSLQVRVGQRAQLAIEGAAQPVAATVVRINPSAQPGSRSVLAYLAVDAVPGLRQGLFAQGRLATGSASAPALPLTAVRTDKPAPYVQVVQDGRVAHKPVQTGERGEAGGETMVAVQGIAPGATVIRGHVGPLREGTAVRLPAATAATASATASATATAAKAAQ